MVAGPFVVPGGVMSWLVVVGGRFYQEFVFEVSARELAWSLRASGVLGVEVREET